jgi:hypothetical protein
MLLQHLASLLTNTFMIASLKPWGAHNEDISQ